MNDKAHVVCPACLTQNRLPIERLGNAPTCGKCKKHLFNAHPVELTTASFDRFIERTDIPVVVDFWAPWCGPCRTMAPAFLNAAKTLEPHMRLVKVDIEAEPAIAGRFSIQSIPTLCLFHRGKEVSRKNGAMTESNIVQWASGA